MYGLQVHQFVLLNNHYHLSCLNPKSKYFGLHVLFFKEVTKEINKYTGQINHVFGGRYKWSLVTAERYFFIFIDIFIKIQFGQNCVKWFSSINIYNRSSKAWGAICNSHYSHFLNTKLSQKKRRLFNLSK